MQFSGQVALITGAARGIGAATARAFAEQGADVALADLADAQPVAEELQAMGRRSLVLRGDVADPAFNEAMVAHTLDSLGRLDVFVPNAAYQFRAPFWEIPLEEYHKVVGVTMWGTLYGVRAAAKAMMPQRSGAIVVVSSGQAVVSCPHSMPYNMAKAAIDHMARTACLELLPYNIRVNVVHPGWTDTPGERKFFTDEELAVTSRKTPGGRLAKPEEIARGIVFLASPESCFINGVTLPIGGGINVARPWNM
jgi:glucose 1-dehydrogenase